MLGELMPRDFAFSANFFCSSLMAPAVSFTACFNAGNLASCDSESGSDFLSPGGTC